MGFAGCMSTSKTDIAVQNIKVSSPLDDKARILEQVKSLIESGMLHSLVKARSLLAANNLGNTEQGKDLDYIAYRLMVLVYPYYKQSSTPAVPLKSSSYPHIADMIQSGKIPEITEENTTFFTLLFSAAAVFYSNSREIIEQCHEIAVQLDTFSKDNPYAKLVEGKVYELKGEWKRSFDSYSKVVSTESDCYPAKIGIARYYVEKKEYSSAIPLLEKLNTLYPGGKDISSLLVESYLDTGEIYKANQLLEDVLSRDPADIDLALKRARLLLLSGQLDQAGKLITVYETEKGATGESINLRANIFIRKRKYAKAEKIIKSGLKNFPRNVSLQITFANLLIITNRFDAAEIYLKEQLKNNKNDPDLVKLLLISYIKQKMWEKASSLLEVLLTPDASDVILRYAVEVYFNLGITDKALEYNKKLILGQKPAIEDYSYRVMLLLGQNKKGEALQELSKWILSVQPSAQKSVMYYLMSLCTTNKEKQKEYLQKALFENLHNLKALLSLADLYVQEGKYRKAYRYLKQASLINPEDNDVKARLQKVEKNL